VRLPLISCAVLLCALPADGSNALLTPPVIQTLTAIDAIPSKTSLNDAFGSQTAFGNLLAIATDRTVDLGIGLRAIRALPAYCPAAPQTCGTGSPAHDALISLIDGLATPHTPQDLLRLRAAVEALGATHSGLAGDADKLLALLGNPSRDVRATVVGAIRNICSKTAMIPLGDLFFHEPSLQVKLAINTALRDLARCPDAGG
jgi:hypothetical protein